ncbi:MAG: hypothetical protein ABR94_09270 [Sphingobacteriales bacterium BACL12 MAG-120802-bin5]|jgi:hypothetical protein|nr:MAG: hypothetical protein ABR94_09270 [Sphingobacteriales bacterium BACL12 MAG-120802-bin5]
MHGGGGINGGNGWTGYTVTYDSIMYYAPCFNPNNSSEFTYIEWDLYLPNRPKWLCTYNIVTGEKQYLADGASFNPVWCTNDWIVFNRGGHIWKIQSNGDNLAPLFTDYACYDVVVNPSSTKMIFYMHNGTWYSTIVSDINGLVLDSIPNSYFGEAAWSPDGQYIASTGSQYHSYGFYDTTLTNYTIIHEGYPNDPPSESVYDAEWYGDSENILWYKNREYFITNITTKQTTLFSSLCYNQFNLWPSVASDNSGILWERNNEANIDGNQYKVSSKTSIELTDMDGNNEFVVLPAAEEVNDWLRFCSCWN